MHKYVASLKELSFLPPAMHSHKTLRGIRWTNKMKHVINSFLKEMIFHYDLVKVFSVLNIFNCINLKANKCYWFFKTVLRMIFGRLCLISLERIINYFVDCVSLLNGGISCFFEMDLSSSNKKEREKQRIWIVIKLFSWISKGERFLVSLSLFWKEIKMHLQNGREWIDLLLLFLICFLKTQ